VAAVTPPPLVIYTRRPYPWVVRVARDLAAATVFRRHRHAGPAAVAASLRRGLKALGVPFRWNPAAPPRGATVAVLSDPEALRRAIGWKRAGRIARLLAGPNLVVTAGDHDALVAAPEIDLYVVPARWTLDHHVAGAPTLAGRIAIWPAGVDAEAFRPPAGPRPRRALVYRKDLAGQENASDALVGEVEAVLAADGWEVARIAYGDHTRHDFRRRLGEASLLVFLSPTESQGIALHEAWAMDVPTLVWDHGVAVLGGERIKTSSAPTLTPRTGAFFTGADELRERLAAMEAGTLHFDPRGWTEEHGTDAKAAEAFLALATDQRRAPTA
jgi:hypothetical protein